MAYTPYVTVEEYEGMGYESFEGIEQSLLLASRHIDTLTFNRIIAIGFDKLTDFQKEIIKQVVSVQAMFEHENADEITNVLKGYSINGVTAQFGDGVGVQTLNGVTISRTNYKLLEQTGLCCRLARHLWHDTRI